MFTLLLLHVLMFVAIMCGVVSTTEIYQHKTDGMKGKDDLWLLEKV